MRLILVRHGESPSNVRHLLDTAEPGPDLTARGAEQAAALPRALADERVDAVYASSLVRAQQTAAPLARLLGLPVHVRAGIREIWAGELELRGDRRSVERYLTTVFAWPEGDLGRRMPGAESGTEVLERFDAVVAEIAATGVRTAVLVSHGAAIRVWTACRASNVDAALASTSTLANTGVVTLEGDPASGWRALSWTGVDLDGPSSGPDAELDPGFL
jgi:probable phosphoglycerate mutase